VTKRELVTEVAERLGYAQNEVSAVVQATLDSITNALADGTRLELRNFGVFELKVRGAHKGRNPRTGEGVFVSEKRITVFKPGKALKDRVEQAPSTETPSSPIPASSEAAASPPVSELSK
jgi:nucleoid DNA-binding protein